MWEKWRCQKIRGRYERMSVIAREERSLEEQFMMGMLMHQATSYTSSNILHISLYFNKVRDQHTGNFSIYKIHGNKVNQGALLLWLWNTRLSKHDVKWAQWTPLEYCLGTFQTAFLLKKGPDVASWRHLHNHDEK